MFSLQKALLNSCKEEAGLHEPLLLINISTLTELFYNHQFIMCPLSLHISATITLYCLISSCVCSVTVCVSSYHALILREDNISLSHLYLTCLFILRIWHNIWQSMSLSLVHSFRSGFQKILLYP